MTETSATTTTVFIRTAEQAPETTRRAGIDFAGGLRWARSVLADPVATSVQASGMPPADLQAIEQAARGNA